MNVIRCDVVGKINMQLVEKPTNTCAGVDNYTLIARSHSDDRWGPKLYPLGTDPTFALYRYKLAKQEAEAVYRVYAA